MNDMDRNVIPHFDKFPFIIRNARLIDAMIVLPLLVVNMLRFHDGIIYGGCAFWMISQIYIYFRTRKRLHVSEDGIRQYRKQRNASAITLLAVGLIIMMLSEHFIYDIYCYAFYLPYWIQWFVSALYIECKYLPKLKPWLNRRTPSHEDEIR